MGSRNCQFPETKMAEKYSRGETVHRTHGSGTVSICQQEKRLKQKNFNLDLDFPFITVTVNNMDSLASSSIGKQTKH